MKALPGINEKWLQICWTNSGMSDQVQILSELSRLNFCTTEAWTVFKIISWGTCYRADIILFPAKFYPKAFLFFTSTCYQHILLVIFNLNYLQQLCWADRQLQRKLVWLQQMHRAKRWYFLWRLTFSCVRYCTPDNREKLIHKPVTKLPYIVLSDM